MIKEKVILDNFSIDEWEAPDMIDERAMHWIWNELMGETAKGDTLSFVVITTIDNPKEKIFAGLLKDKNDEQKAIIPAIYENIKDGIMEVIDYTGELSQTQIRVVNGKTTVKTTTTTVDEMARKMFGLMLPS